MLSPLPDRNPGKNYDRTTAGRINRRLHRYPEIKAAHPLGKAPGVAKVAGNLPASL
jgi:hypothetical protein